MQPLVAVVTPVYNGAAYLAEAIKSVQAQTYDHWTYSIVDNQSTDATNAVAQRFTAGDSRISVACVERHLSMVANWNEAIRRVPSDAVYVKVLHADDMLFPTCLEQMVALAEAHPSVGIVAAYRLSGDKVELDGLPFPSTVTSGPEVARRSLLAGLRVFGSPSSLLLRADLVRARPEFYNEANRHADTEVCYELLQHCDFGFVHQILTYTRRHPAQMTTFSQRQNSFLLAALGDVLRFGPVFLSEAELCHERSRLLRAYYWYLGRNLLRRDPHFWAYHRDTMAQFGLRLSRTRLLAAAMGQLADAMLNPKRSVERSLKRMYRARARRSPAARPSITSVRL